MLSTTTVAPSLRLLATEPLRAFVDYASSHFAAPKFPQGTGQPVLVIPGLGGGALSTGRLRRALTNAGFAAHDWGLGTNTGPKNDFDGWLAEMDDTLRRLFIDRKQKVSLVGWSLGGIFAREVAKRHPRMVQQVITLGTPWKDFETGTNVGKMYKLINRGASGMSADLRLRLTQIPDVPLTAIYSKNDGIVAWQTCVLQPDKMAESIEVSKASHLGMGTNRDVLRLVAETLSRKAGSRRKELSIVRG